MSPDEVKQQIRRWDKNAGDIKIISTGANNIVGLAGSVVYRFPFTKDALSLQLYEVELYKRLNNKLNVPVPQLIRTYEEPACIAITRLDGDHISVDELAGLSTKDLHGVIRQLLQFNIALNEVISPEIVAELEKTYIANQLYDRLWLDYFSKHLEKARFPEQPWLEDLAHKQYAKWLDITSSSTLPRITIHEDLNDQNILFVDHKVSGILDFEECTVGTIAQELRPLFRMGEQAVQIAIDEYSDLTGILIDLEEVKAWAVTQELGAYCRWFAKGDLSRPSFVRSQANLNRWLDSFQELAK